MLREGRRGAVRKATRRGGDSRGAAAKKTTYLADAERCGEAGRSCAHDNHIELHLLRFYGG